ncbi:MAG: polysaccharide lyase 6 family protein [Luteolibacter sp.]
MSYLKFSRNLSWLWLLGMGLASAAEYSIGSSDDLEELKLAAGDVIIWKDGVYKDQEIRLNGMDGTDENPITLRAETDGGVKLQGESQITIGAKHWLIQGFHFDGSGGLSNYNAVQFRGSGDAGAEHVTLSHCAFTDLDNGDDSAKWVQIYGRYNTIRNCHFSGKKNLGALITVELGSLEADEVAGHVIEYNYFADFAFGKGTDNECIRVGYSGDQNKPATCKIQHNFFIRCNGENEIISNKSSYNTYYHNTFRESNGALVLRHGHHATVDSNYFFGDGATDSGGIRVVDSHHVIQNNYMEGLTGQEWNSAFTVLGGNEKSGGEGNGYQKVEGVTIKHNTIVDCARSVYFSKKKGKTTPSGVFANNLISSKAAPLITDDLPVTGFTWSKNVFHGAEVGAEVRAIEADPQMSRWGLLLRPSEKGSAKDAADPTYSVEKDVDGEARTGAADIGADEVSSADEDRVLKPLTAEDVGVDYLK